MLDVGGEEHAGYVVFVGGEVGYRDEGGFFAVLEEVPYVDVALGSILAWKHSEWRILGWWKDLDGTNRIGASAKS